MQYFGFLVKKKKKKWHALNIILAKRKKNLFATWGVFPFLPIKQYGTLTLWLLGDGHVQPLQVDAVLAADAGCSAAEGMEGYGAYDQRQLETQLGCSGYINTNLTGGKRVYNATWTDCGLRTAAAPMLGQQLTFSMYSTLMMRHCRMDGPTGGILMARPCQVSRRLAPTMSPQSVATTERFCFMVPRAMNVCVWMIKALGTTDLEVELSNSAKTGITSPVEREKARLERWDTTKVWAHGKSRMCVPGV